MLARPLPPLAPGDGSAGGGPPPRPCSVAAVRSCALPYPSNEFTVPDGAAATGLRPEFPEGLLPAHLVGQLGPGATPEEAARGADGFAALSPVIFELERPVIPWAVPGDGGDVVAVFDADTGERVPMRVEVPADAARHGAPDTIVWAWPRSRFEPGHTYVARVTDVLPTWDGAALTKVRGLRDASNATVSDLRNMLRGVEGDRWGEVVTATSFTVRSAANATAELDRMAAIARSEDHPFRNVQVGLPFLFRNTSAVVTGEVRVSDFRDRHGVARAEHGSTGRWVRFLMALPNEPAGPAGAPVAIYGHGLTVAKETMIGVASANAELGVATIGIDVPNHGDRQAGFDGGYLLDLTEPARFGRLSSMAVQGVVDNLSLLLAVRDHLGGMELMLPDLPWRTGVAAPRLDTSTILYQGTSMGGVLGATFTGIAPELDGAFLQVAGTGIADVIFHSMLWPLFMPLVPYGASTGDAYAFMGAATMLLDAADNVNVLDRIRDGDTPLFLAYGVNDGIVRNTFSDRMVGLLGLPLVGPQLAELESAPRPTGSDVPPADGRGVAQIWSSAPMEMQSFGGHIAFAEPRAERIMQEWVAGRLRAAGVGGATP